MNLIHLLFVNPVLGAEGSKMSKTSILSPKNAHTTGRDGHGTVNIGHHRLE